MSPSENRKTVQPSAAQILALREVARSGALNTPLRMSSRELAEQLELSQQTASRQLKELEVLGLLARDMAVKGQVVTVTPRGRGVLEAEYARYQDLFEGPAQLEIEGLVETGLGEGSYYITLPGYLTQFKQLLGFTPFPGTLNLRPDESMRSSVERLRATAGITINGFEQEGRSFGGATCHPATLFRSDEPHEVAEGAVIVPNRTHYRRVIEIIAPRFLREQLDVQDGDLVSFEVELKG